MSGLLILNFCLKPDLAYSQNHSLQQRLFCKELCKHYPSKNTSTSFLSSACLSTNMDSPKAEGQCLKALWLTFKSGWMFGLSTWIWKWSTESKATHAIYLKGAWTWRKSNANQRKSNWSSANTWSSRVHVAMSVKSTICAKEWNSTWKLHLNRRIRAAVEKTASDCSH